MTLEVQVTKKKKIDNLDFIKIKNYCASKDTTKNMKDRLTDMVKREISKYIQKGKPEGVKNRHGDKQNWKR